MNVPGVKNQHYVPRFYFKSFTNELGYLSVVRRDNIVLKPIFRSKPWAFAHMSTAARKASGIVYCLYLHQIDGC